MPAYSQLECVVPMTGEYSLVLGRFFRAVATALGQPDLFDAWLRDVQIFAVDPGDALHGFQFASSFAGHREYAIADPSMRCRPIAMGWGPPAFEELGQRLLAMQLCFWDEDIWEPPPAGHLRFGVPEQLQRGAVAAHKALDEAAVFFTDEVTNGLPIQAAWRAGPPDDVWKCTMAVCTSAWLSGVPAPPSSFTELRVDDTAVLWRSSALAAQ